MDRLHGWMSGRIHDERGSGAVFIRGNKKVLVRGYRLSCSPSEFRAHADIACRNWGMPIPPSGGDDQVMAMVLVEMSLSFFT